MVRERALNPDTSVTLACLVVCVQVIEWLRSPAAAQGLQLLHHGLGGSSGSGSRSTSSDGSSKRSASSDSIWNTANAILHGKHLYELLAAPTTLG